MIGPALAAQHSRPNRLNAGMAEHGPKRSRKSCDDGGDQLRRDEREGRQPPFVADMIVREMDRGDL